MITFPNAKINIGLYVTGKRQDGYHNIETLLYPIGWHDALEILPSSELRIRSLGLPIERNAYENLCVKAYHLLKTYYDLPPVEIILFKSIPVGAGLGGGSADGAFMLRLLNEKFALGLNDDKLEEFAAQLGSDCPFFIRNKPSLATGKGEILEHFSIDITTYQLVVAYPALAVSTTWAYSRITPTPPLQPLREALKLPIEQWRDKVFNDFECVVFRAYPTIKVLKEKMYAVGALYASMSGSGSAVFGLFQKGTVDKDICEKLNVYPENIWIS